MFLGVLVVGRRDLGEPRVEVLRGDLPQHRVDEPRPPVAQYGPGQLHGGRDRRVRRDPGAEQLVGAQREYVEHRRVDLAQRPVDAGGDHGVVRALVAQRAVHQLGRQRGVPAVEGAAPLDRVLLGGPQQAGQDEVRVRVALADRA